MQALEGLILLLENHWSDIEILLYGLQSEKGWTAPTPHFEVYYFIDGGNTLQINGIPFTAVCGDFFFSDYTVNCTCPDAKYKIYYISFTCRDKHIYSMLAQCFSVFTRTGFPIHAPGLEADFAALCSEISLARLFHSLMVKHGLVNLLIKLNRKISGLSQTGSDRPTGLMHEKTVDEIARYIDCHFTEKICLPDIGNRFGLNERYLNRIFKAATGSTIIEYLIKVRIAHAKRLLEVTRSTITDIASETGFFDCAHFSRTFKRLERKSPAAYRSKSGGGLNVADSNE